MVQEGLKAAIADLIPAEFEMPSGEKIKITIDEAALAKPSVPIEAVGVKNQNVLPTECRQRAATYKGDFKIRLNFNVDGRSIVMDRSLGNLPIMLKVKEIFFTCTNIWILVKYPTAISVFYKVNFNSTLFQSKVCHLADLSPEELVKHNEHADEWGGYFIIKVKCLLFCKNTSQSSPKSKQSLLL